MARYGVGVICLDKVTLGNVEDEVVGSDVVAGIGPGVVVCDGTAVVGGASKGMRPRFALELNLPSLTWSGRCSRFSRGDLGNN